MTHRSIITWTTHPRAAERRIVGRIEANIISLENLEADVLEHFGAATVPCVIQYNKRDCPDTVDLAVLRRQLNRHRWPEFEAVAAHGIGVQTTGREALRLAIRASQRQLPGDPEADRRARV